jgi:drug/metabolite transporter (DMT)-like permease
LAIISAVLATTLGSYFNGETARIAGASFLGIMTTSLPLMIIPLNYFINKEKISFAGLIGILIIFAGVLLLFIF